MDIAQLVPVTLSPEEQFERLLQQRRQQPHRAHEIDAAIRDRFLQTYAIAVLDMVGFTHLTQTQGIIATLEAIYALREIAIPTLEEHAGTVLKAEADNLYAVFPNPIDALIAAQHLLTRLNAADLHASIGIGYGEVLVVGDRDLYGDEMNLASKLGEDLARNDEILLTKSAFNALAKTEYRFTAFAETISGVNLTLYQLQRSEV